MTKWIPVLLVLILVLAGCSLLFPEDQYRNPPATPGSLEFEPAPPYNGTDEPAEHLRDNGTYHIPLEITVHGNFGGAEGSEWVFHDVTVMGFSNKGNKLCSDEAGNISRGQEREVVLECPVPPWIIGLTAEESPCDEHIEIQYIRYDKTDIPGVDAEYTWQSELRKCGQELPPTPSEETSIASAGTVERTVG